MGTRAQDSDTEAADRAAESGVLDWWRALLWVSSAGEVKNAAIGLINELGGWTVRVDRAGDGTLDIDISFGEGQPQLPAAPPGSTALLRLRQHVPRFVQDGYRALELASQRDRLTREAWVDPLTGLANRRSTGRAVGRLRPGDAVVIIDLDHFKDLNDQAGHAAGDEVLAAFGELLGAEVRARDHAGRFGGEEFVLILAGDDPDADPEALLARLRARWREVTPHPVTFSAGIAVAEQDAPQDALLAADQAMYQAKRAGRDRWMRADPYMAQTTPDPADSRSSEIPAFVAYSQLDVPEQAVATVERAFRNRLGKVDGWPGFQSLEVWQDTVEPTAYVLVTWWDDEHAFREYMRSSDHRESHGRVPKGADRPRPVAFHRYRRISR